MPLDSRSCVSGLVPGDASGDREGKDSSVLAEAGVTSECFREPALTVPVLPEAVESWDEVRSKLTSLLLPPAILKSVGDRYDQRIFRTRQDRRAYICSSGVKRHGKCLS